MKATLALLASAAMVAAQSNPAANIPECAQKCVMGFTENSKVDGCNLLDIKCICTKSSFIDQIACCIEPVCDAAGKQAVLAFAAKICQGTGADLPTVVTCSTSVASSTTSASESSSSGGSGSASTTSSDASAESGSSSATSGATSAPATTTGASGSGTASSPAATASTTSKSNAAAVNGPAGVFGALAAVAFAL